MNFFKALFSINSLSEKITNLEQQNVDLATHNLQLQGQLESMRNHTIDQHHIVSKLKADNDRMYAELGKLKSLKRNQKAQPSNPAPSMAAPKQTNQPQPNNNHQNKSRRGRKPKAVNQ